MGKLGLALCMLFAGCATTGPEIPPTAFRLEAPGLGDNSMLAQRNAGNLKTNPNCLGQNISPALRWSNVPGKTRSLVLLMDDQAGRGGLGVSHLVAYGIPSSVSTLDEGELSTPSNKYVAGKTTPGPTGYFGPCPPRGNAPQHYIMTLIATDLDPGALKAGLTKDEVLKALQGGRALRAASLAFRYAH